jgi:hypothetical protein
MKRSHALGTSPGRDAEWLSGGGCDLVMILAKDDEFSMNARGWKDEG